MGGYLGEWAWVHILSRLSVCLEIGRSYVLQRKIGMDVVLQALATKWLVSLSCLRSERQDKRFHIEMVNNAKQCLHSKQKIIQDRLTHNRSIMQTLKPKKSVNIFDIRLVDT